MSGLTPNAQNRMDKRILIDATNVNITKPGGGSACVRAYIEALLVLFPGRVDVILPEEARIHDSRFNTIYAYPRKPLARVMGLFKGQIHRGASVVISHLKKHYDEYEYVFLNGGLQASSIISATLKMPIKTIVLHHNFESEYQIDSRTLISLKGRTDLFIRYLEKRAYRNATVNLFLTQQDQSLFENAYGKRANNHITGIFEPTNERASLTPSCNKSAVITCSLGAEQNKYPILRFIDNYYPVFTQLLPNWQLQIMGRAPGREIMEIGRQHANITIVPNPQDIHVLASQSTIYICPMDAGGGIKLRIMDGLRMGQPILVHERSARGYDILFDKPFFKIYNDSESFAFGINALIQYTQKQPDYRQIIQDTYYETFSLKSGISRLRGVFQMQKQTF